MLIDSFLLLEPHEGDGRLLCRPHETLRRSQVGTADNSGIGLHRIYTYTFPKLIALTYYYIYYLFRLIKL